jgi:transaldolase
LKAVQIDAYRSLFRGTVKASAKLSPPEVVDQLLVAFGTRILQIVPGRISTEIDARLAFDARGTVERARGIMALYEAADVKRDRVLIKIAATWEGIQAARALQFEGINCNLTLVFSLAQAAAAAEAKAQLISPFVGRIYDWYKEAEGSAWVEEQRSGANDPGVQSVIRIHRYYKSFGIETEIMGASFRNTGQILALSGCDLLTISPDLLEALSKAEGEAPARLTKDGVPNASPAPVATNEVSFRTVMNDDPMATGNLSDGVRKFAADAVKLDTLIVAQRD